MSAIHLSSFPLLKNLEPNKFIGQSFYSIESLHLDPRPAKQLLLATARYKTEGLYSKQKVIAGIVHEHQTYKIFNSASFYLLILMVFLTVLIKCIHSFNKETCHTIHVDHKRPYITKNSVIL